MLLERVRLNAIGQPVWLIGETQDGKLEQVRHFAYAYCDSFPALNCKTIFASTGRSPV